MEMDVLLMLFVLYFHPKLSAAVTHGKKGKGSKVCEINNQGAMHADETAIQSVLALKGQLKCSRIMALAVQRYYSII